MNPFQIAEQPDLEEPEWAIIKQASRQARNAKAAQTRDKNSILRARMSTRNIVTQAGTPESQIPHLKAAQGSHDTSMDVKEKRKRRRKLEANIMLRRSPRLLRQ